MWMAGGGVKGGIDLRHHRRATARKPSTDKVHVHDLHATILAPAGPRPREADLPLRRPRLPPDRRVRERGEADHRVSGRREETGQSSKKGDGVCRWYGRPRLRRGGTGIPHCFPGGTGIPVCCLGGTGILACFFGGTDIPVRDRSASAGIVFGGTGILACYRSSGAHIRLVEQTFLSVTGSRVRAFLPAERTGTGLETAGCGGSGGAGMPLHSPSHHRQECLFHQFQGMSSARGPDPVTDKNVRPTQQAPHPPRPVTDKNAVPPKQRVAHPRP